MKHAAIVCFASVIFQLPTFAQGPLTPPGPPAPTMKTLDLMGFALVGGAGVFTGAGRWLEIGVRTNGGGAFKNNGSGGFASASTNTVGNNPFAVAVADVNGDGQPDLRKEPL